MREESIRIYPFEELCIEDYEGLKQVNEHAHVKLTGTIPFYRKEEYFQLGNGQTWVKVAAVSEENEHVLFYGVTEEMKLHVINGICQMELVLRSGTSLMDYENKIRSFQNSELTYRELLSTCSRSYEEAAYIMTEGREQTIGHFIMQYQETDWEFIKRLASMNGTVVIADCSTEGEKYYFGLPNRKATIAESFVEYQTQCDMEEYQWKKGRGINVKPTDTISCIWESREIYELGDWGIIDNQEMVVWKIESKMKGNVLYHTYYAKVRSGFRIPEQYHEAISGVTLFGQILAVKDEKVQIEILEDENQEGAGTCWFTYATVYSSQDGTGWYCMPEIGDKVRLCFPTDNEQEAYVANAYHEADTRLRTKPECKFWRNKEGKEIQLSPKRILLTNNNGTYVELSDQEGIHIVSKGSVTVRAEGALSISSRNSSVELSAPKRIRIRQGETEMSLGGELRMRGAQIRL